MAKTKRTLRIFSGTATSLATTKNIAGETDTVTLADLPALDGGTPSIPTGSSLVSYNAATKGVVDVDFSNITAYTAGDESHPKGIDWEVTLIDVTEGREKFPRRTITAPTLTELKDAINGLEIQAGDGKSYECTFLNDGNTPANNIGVKITMPEDTVTRVAATDGANITQVTAPVFHTGYTREEAIEYCKQIAAVQYGRTNRIKFPVVEPNIEANLPAGVGFSLLVVPIVSETKFDKNFGAGYQDVEYAEFLLPGAWATNLAA